MGRVLLAQGRALTLSAFGSSAVYDSLSGGNQGGIEDWSMLMNQEVRVEETPGWTPAASLVRRVSWGAIFAGMFVTIVLQIMLTLLGTAVGASSIDPLRQQDPGRGLAIGSAIWLLVTSLISIWMGACVAGRLSGGPLRTDGLLHGVVSWSVSTVGMILALATVGGALLGATGGLLGGALAIGSSSQGKTTTLTSLEDQLKQILPQAGPLLPPTGRNENNRAPGNLTAFAQQDAELSAVLARLESNGGAAKSAADRDQAVNLLSSRHGLSQQDANNLLNDWDQQFQQARAQAGPEARQAGSAAARGVAQGSLWGFIALILGLLAAASGGWAGVASLPPYEELRTTTVSP